MDTQNTKEDINPMTAQRQQAPQMMAAIGGQPMQQSLDKDIYRAEANLEQLNRFKALREAARPLMEFLAQSGHPHHTALVDVTGVRIVEDQVSVKF